MKSIETALSLICRMQIEPIERVPNLRRVCTLLATEKFSPFTSCDEVGFSQCHLGWLGYLFYLGKILQLPHLLLVPLPSPRVHWAHHHKPHTRNLRGLQSFHQCGNVTQGWSHQYDVISSILPPHTAIIRAVSHPRHLSLCSSTAVVVAVDFYIATTSFTMFLGCRYCRTVMPRWGNRAGSKEERRWRFCSSSCPRHRRHGVVVAATVRRTRRPALLCSVVVGICLFLFSLRCRRWLPCIRCSRRGVRRGTGSRPNTPTNVVGPIHCLILAPILCSLVILFVGKAYLDAAVVKVVAVAPSATTDIRSMTPLRRSLQRRR